LGAVALAALAGIVQFHLEGEPVVNMPFSLDAKIGCQARGIAGTQLVAAATAEVGDAEAAMDTEPGRLSESMAGLEKRQERQEGKYFSHKKVDFDKKNLT
jgi:hypothetical protein